ncbi:MAG: hypothetical protein HY951_15345 [Bacteroidia bacterium]|nr:hypothetical protein [Bacteroidia bacterium]
MNTFFNFKYLFATIVIAMCPYLILAQIKMEFSSKPFSKGGAEQKEFTWNTPIYGKISINKPLKNYAKKIDAYAMEKLHISGVYSSYISLYCIPTDEDIDRRTNVEITLYLTNSELEKNEINLDIMPVETEATTFYGTGFSDELARMGIVQYDPETEKTVGKKTEFKIYLHEDLPSVSQEEIGTKNGRIVLASGIYNTLGSITIDYTTVTDSREVGDWKDRCTAITDSIQSKYNK